MVSRLRINCFSKATFTIWLLKEKGQLNSVDIVLALLRRFQKRPQICRENGLFQHLTCMKSRSQRTLRRHFSSFNCQISFLPCGHFHLTSIKASYKFSRDFKFRSSRKTRISKTSAQHRSVLSKFVLWGLPREYKIYYYSLKWFLYFQKFKVALNATYRIFLNFAKRCA